MPVSRFATNTPTQDDDEYDQMIAAANGGGIGDSARDATIARADPFADNGEPDNGRSPYDAPMSGTETPSPDKKTGGYYDPTSDDPRMQKYRERIDEINDQLKGRSTFFGGNDSVTRGLLAQKQSLVNEMHGEAQLAGQYSKAQMQQQGQLERAQTAANARYYGADQGLAGRKYAADRGLAGRQYGADQGLVGREYGADQRLAGVGLQQAGANSRNTASNTSREGMNTENNQTRVNLGNLGAETAQARNATISLNDAYQRALVQAHQADNPADAAVIYKQADVYRKMLEAQASKPAPQAKPPVQGGAAAPQDFGPANGKPDGATGTLPDGTKVVVKNGRVVSA